MGLQSELFDRAANCERLTNLTSDHNKRLTLRLVRDLWIALANESPGMSERALSRAIAALDEMLSGFDLSVGYVVAVRRLAHFETSRLGE